MIMRAFLATLLMSGSVATVAGCEPSDGTCKEAVHMGAEGPETGCKKDCNLSADNPHKSKNNNKDYISGKGTVKCTVDATDVLLHVTLRKKKGSEWVDAAAYSTMKTKTVLEAGKRFDEANEAECQAGVFQTLATVQYTIGGKTESKRRVSVDVKDPCEKK